MHDHVNFNKGDIVWTGCIFCSSGMIVWSDTQRSSKEAKDVSPEAVQYAKISQSYSNKEEPTVEEYKSHVFLIVIQYTACSMYAVYNYSPCFHKHIF